MFNCARYTSLKFTGVLVIGVFLTLGVFSANAALQSPGVEIGPNHTQQAEVGQSIVYNHVLTNTGATTDTFMLEVLSTQGWPVELLGGMYPTGTSALPLQVGAQMIVPFQISLTVPVHVAGVTEITIITATSQISPTVQDTATDTTMVLSRIFLPLITRRWPPVPYTPVLNAISNTDGDGNYTVSWDAALLADTYTLQEDDNASFSSPTTAYGPGAATSTSITGKPAGTYYYRVKATNNYGDSAWSNVQSVYVRPPGTLYSVGDACILQGYPTMNAGNTSDMWAGYDDYLDPDGKIVRSLIQFDTSVIPAGTPIASAVLRVYLVGSWDYPGRTRTITTYRIGSGWSESSVTWNTQPSIGEAYGSTGVTHGSGGWYSFNVTDLVRGWVNGTLPNYGVMLRGPEKSGSDSSWKAFSTRQGNYTPQLVITYSGYAALSNAELGVEDHSTERASDTIIETLIGGANADFLSIDLCRSHSWTGEKCLALP
jgi:hypothetical protein